MGMLSWKYSFHLVNRKEMGSSSRRNVVATEVVSVQETVSVDEQKRSFLKLAGIAGAGVIASQLLPKKAEAYVMGSNPSSALGIKDASNTRINPATEDTLALIKTQTNLLTFDAGTNPANLKVNVNAGDVGVQNIANAVINPATEDTLAIVKNQVNKLTFDGSNNLLTSVGGTGNVVGLKDTTNTQINPATDDSLVYLRRMVKLMESQAAVDSANRQRIAVDSWGSVTTGNGVGVAGASGTLRVSVASDSGFATNIATLNGWGDQMFQDVARNTYANGVRYNLAFS